MKTRKGFVSNSSSSSFLINNDTDQRKTLVDFVNENPHLVKEFCEQYDWYTYTQEQMLEGAALEDITWEPYESKNCVFGDEQGTVIGTVFDYILRDGGKSESFTWAFLDHMR